MLERLWGIPVFVADGASRRRIDRSVRLALTAREQFAVHRPEAFERLYLDEVGYPAWVGEFVPDGWD